MSGKINGVFFVLFFTALTVGCSNYLSSDDWGIFTDLHNKDLQGETVGCKTLTSSTVVQEPNRTFGSPIVYDVLDYMFNNDVSFNQCRDMLDNVISKYCERRVSSAYDSIIKRKNHNYNVSSKAKYFCSDTLRERLVVNFRYSLPSKDNMFITLEDIGVMIKPSSISKIDFGSHEEFNLNYLSLYTEDGGYKLMFSDIDLFEKAKADFAYSATVFSNENSAVNTNNVN